MEDNSWLQYVASKANELSKPPAPAKRKQPKVTRMQSARMRAIESQTSNIFKAGFVSAEQASEQWKYVRPANEDVTTREVGPGDVHNPVTGYSTGKATGYRNVGK